MYRFVKSRKMLFLNLLLIPGNYFHKTQARCDIFLPNRNCENKTENQVGSFPFNHIKI